MARVSGFGLGRMAYFLLALLCVMVPVNAVDEVVTSAEYDTPEWATDNAMQLTLSSRDGGDSPLQYTVIPLTESLGLNESDRYRKIIHIEGNIIAADASNYNKITQPTDIAYLTCDDSADDSFIQPDKMLNDLMKVKPKAIVLYSTNRNWCSLSYGRALSYSSIFSMADAAEATQLLSHLNGTDNGEVVQALITGNTTARDSDRDERRPGDNSAVAMSILYGITGLITLLFLIIIASGAVRAHRYPERYGPRSALGGRPRQSRAKGLARAVLDTMPIVKFGNQTPAKPDPELELETATNDGRENTNQRATSVLSEQRPAEGVVAGSGGNDLDSTAPEPRTSQTGEAEDNDGDHLGCSICTEDFKVNEDVRVLPCQHQFHPECVDPWLINVSGTCPLCRYDLRPNQSANQSDGASGSASEGETLPPPLALDVEDNEGSHSTHRNRFTRLFDPIRLRQATHEEQIRALRQMRAETHEEDSHAADHESRGQRARVAERLRERFRIRTRAQPAE